MIIETGKASPARIRRRNEVASTQRARRVRMYVSLTRKRCRYFFFLTFSVRKRCLFGAEKTRSRARSVETNGFFCESQSSHLNRPRSRYFSLSFHSHSRLFLPSVVASVGGCTRGARLFCNHVENEISSTECAATMSLLYANTRRSHISYAFIIMYCQSRF